MKCRAWLAEALEEANRDPNRASLVHDLPLASFGGGGWRN